MPLSHDIRTRFKKPVTLFLCLLGLCFGLFAVLDPEFPVIAAPYGPAPTVVTPNIPPVVTPRPVFVPPVGVPIDVEPGLNNFQGAVLPGGTSLVNSPALSGIQLLPDSSFPNAAELTGPTSGITIKQTEGTSFEKLGKYVIKLVKGEILVSVKRPSQTAIVNTPFGAISISANGDVIIKIENGVQRVTNLDGTGQTIKVQLNQGPFAGPQDPTVALAPGFELIASSTKLTRSNLRPRDGIARRHFKVLENGHMAISEISVESVLRASDVVADFRQKVTGSKDRRILSDMSKMAAVLNYKNGTQGFTVEE